MQTPTQTSPIQPRTGNNHLFFSLFILLLAAVLITSCKKDQAYCDEARDEMMATDFKGLIFICNGLPGQKTIGGQATVTAAAAGQMTVHLVSDTTSLDTVLNFAYDCLVVEKDIPILYIRDGTGNEIGQFNSSPARISFPFAYNNCTRLDLV